MRTPNEGHESKKGESPKCLRRRRLIIIVAIMKGVRSFVRSFVRKQRGGLKRLLRGQSGEPSSYPHLLLLLL